MSIIHDVAATLAVMALVVGVILFGVWLQLRHFRSELRALSNTQWRRMTEHLFKLEVSSESIKTTTRKSLFLQTYAHEHSPQSPDKTDEQVAVWNSLPGYGDTECRKQLLREIADHRHQLRSETAVGLPQPVGDLGKLHQRPGENSDLIDQGIDDLLRRRGVAGHPQTQRLGRLLDDAIEVFANLIGESHDETSPSSGGCGDPTVGDGPVAEVSEEAPATEGTDTPGGVDTSPLVVHKMAVLEDAIKASNDTFFRIRRLTSAPVSPQLYKRIAKLGNELLAQTREMERCASQVEQARADEVSRGEAGTFSNRRRPGARFSHPTPPDQPH
ncbi:MAG: hypothetical protein U5O16_23440 [Rhodococcus sp. (in: high G+C Gram-positive bacteria)]|uniref:hypothetical protein n=1 Tax=Rhodococcus sp. TaxID=1831 RepID=UPI002ADC69D2|nr:hypothetical protein [Rhodococcus sp. (in: high G+C Gram-positive bacteria)]